jgi:predicted metalloprotease
VPFEFDSGRVDVGGVDDRRGMGGGLAVGGGAGVVGLIITVVVVLLGGGNTSALQLPGVSSGAGGASAESLEELEQRCNTEGALDQYTDCRLIGVYNVADAVWADEFARRGLAYDSPRLAFFTGATSTGCGQASASVGPFYCPPDQEIFFELDFLQQLQDQFGAQGQFAQAYIAAHEFGHHLQTLLGTERQVRAAQQQNPSRGNELSIAMELQADCYAGVWANLADARGEGGIVLDEADVAEAVRAAEAVGDDRIQEKVQGRVSPESWTHGSAEQRSTWFRTGYRSGDMAQCDTFAA